MNKRSAFLTYLEYIANSNDDTIAKFVANEALDREDSVEKWFEDLLKHGCRSGMISQMIYYTDTRVFFIKHYDEIIQIKKEYEDAISQQMNLDYQLANHLAWFSAEYVASKLYKFYF